MVIMNFCVYTLKVWVFFCLGYHFLIKSILNGYSGLDHGNGNPAILEKCLYTITTDSQPIVDHYGPAVILGCGFSGSGFKNSPAWGKMLTCLALSKEKEIPEWFQIEKYRLQRF